jgi:hypothetical protein
MLKRMMEIENVVRSVRFRAEAALLKKEQKIM